MVALHNRRLSARDLFPGVLWGDAEWNAKRDEIRAALAAEGIEEPRLSFRTARDLEAHQRSQPSLRERQAVQKRLATGSRQRSPSLELTEEEIAWLADRLAGVNEPLGRDILDKLAALGASR